MKFRTELNVGKSNFNIKHSDKILMLGSCFIENISDRLAWHKFNVSKNPFGIIYNPRSLADIIDRIIDIKKPQKEEFVERNDVWHHFDFHSDMSDVSLQKAIENIGIRIEQSHQCIKACDYLFLTFGTSIVHINNSTGKVVANNHKFPTSQFVKTRLTQHQIVSLWQSTIERLYAINNNMKIIFTVSPVRHVKDGIVENQKSKATLILAIDELVDEKRTFYFPSYELLQDDLRDYRFYAKDLVHPSDEAVDYIWEKFSDTYFEESTLHLNQQIDKINKSLSHRPLHLESKSYLQFRLKLKENILEFCKKYPQINFTEELKRF